MFHVHTFPPLQRYGQLELVRINKEKKNGFINFIDARSAEELFAEAQQSSITMYQQQVKIGWAKSAPLRPEIQEAISQGATRNLYIGNISDNINEDHLRELIAPYCHGEFAGIYILREKKIAFVNLISIKAAIQARQALMSVGWFVPPHPSQPHFFLPNADRVPLQHTRKNLLYPPLSPSPTL